MAGRYCGNQPPPLQRPRPWGRRMTHMFRDRSGSDTQPHQKRDRIEVAFLNDPKDLEAAGEGKRDSSGTRAGQDRDNGFPPNGETLPKCCLLKRRNFRNERR
ncbi:hypothetical protein RHIZ404_200277 [Rhizobium sp. EC-SD404]|nr:hypothetical protein RHIZ404_200277 [Rhizobium sp. EC-SD404]